MTALYNSIIYGPVKSRRLGISLGINLLPTHSKACSFDCVYCECGWNSEHPGPHRFPTVKEVEDSLRESLVSLKESGMIPDTMTFAGNGEPTIHPDFPEIIDITIALRNQYAPKAKISVLSNATRIYLKDVRNALLKVDNNILKLDSAFNSTAQVMNIPVGNYSIEEIVTHLKEFEGNLTIQTMFLKGDNQGQKFDNTTEEEISAWLELIGEIHPKSVMVYSIARDTPCQTLEKVPMETLEKIKQRVMMLGIDCTTA